VTKVQGAIQAIEEKLKGRTLTEAEWLALTEAKKTLENRLETCKKELIQTEQTYQETLAKWDKLQRLRKDEAAIAKEAALLNELEKVFKGKRFVEFVATTRLKYIVKDASKRLKEISNGTYGLEIDDNGKFLVKDYKNGGILRDTNTLSGGETFLTSLALALALSGAMQLKGTAPLELFFLDEGFGTLDDEALDTVMNSLERLHHQRLKIGLISHVEAIKNRMPTKLIVRPATPGKGGTKVALEKS
jgi:exonuclease SbcC